MLRFIEDTARNAAMNMAIDEYFFTGLKDDAVLRTYTWDNPYITIGYFQKNQLSATRRLTGGLLVNHKDDLSYSFCSGLQSWPYMYSQQDTYKHIHLAVKKALSFIGFDCDFVSIGQNTPKNMFCVQTLYTDDLSYKGKKILGSCMRRRGTKILVQGSVHLELGDSRRSEFCREFANNMAQTLNTNLNYALITDDEIKSSLKIADEKYESDEWNKKF